VFIIQRMPISNAPTDEECKNAVLNGEQIDISYAFQRCCATGNLSTAKWLLETCKVDPHDSNEYAFRFACSNGYLEVAQWLYEYYPNVRSENDFAFRWSCKHGYRRVSDWLIALMPDQYAYGIDANYMTTYKILG
jgi:hypothetical protein